MKKDRKRIGGVSGGNTLSVGPEVEIGRNPYFGGFSLTTESGSTIKRKIPPISELLKEEIRL